MADGASLEWLPQEAMAYDGAAQQRFTIALAPTARFFGWEMLCLGRTTRGERFAVASSGKASDWCVPAAMHRYGANRCIWSATIRC